MSIMHMMRIGCCRIHNFAHNNGAHSEHDSYRPADDAICSQHDQYASHPQYNHIRKSGSYKYGRKTA